MSNARFARVNFERKSITYAFLFCLKFLGIEKFANVVQIREVVLNIVSNVNTTLHAQMLTGNLMLMHFYFIENF